MNPNAQKMAEDILNMLVEWDVVDKNDPDYQLFTQDIVSYLTGAASLSEAMIERLQQKAANLHEAALAIADQIAEAEAFGAEPDEAGDVEVTLRKDEIDKFYAVVYNWNK